MASRPEMTPGQKAKLLKLKQDYSTRKQDRALIKLIKEIREIHVSLLHSPQKWEEARKKLSLIEQKAVNLLKLTGARVNAVYDRDFDELSTSIESISEAQTRASRKIFDDAVTRDINRETTDAETKFSMRYIAYQNRHHSIEALIDDLHESVKDVKTRLREVDVEYMLVLGYRLQYISVRVAIEFVDDKRRKLFENSSVEYNRAVNDYIE